MIDSPASFFDSVTAFYNIEIKDIHIFGWVWNLKVGKLVGFIGTFLFAGRWVVQLGASKIKGRPVLPLLFWYMSISGSLLLLSYFVFGQNDSVGIVNNLFPMLIAFYNLYLELKHRAKASRAEG
ncbi:MAG: lipid-A-disaccharide synthase N-terminal domain-containing protein [Candidatus Methylacidiphilales bacterium]|nr:lipid-A-disaccharide synthase N-terminal domain-containing protein [Candidatus Methylacidiphilales bacterium]